MPRKALTTRQALRFARKMLPPAHILRMLNNPVVKQGSSSPFDESDSRAYTPEHLLIPGKSPKRRAIIKNAKPPQQREAIMYEIAYLGWHPLSIPRSGKKQLQLWFCKKFGKKEATFLLRWKEMRKMGWVEMGAYRQKSKNAE